MNHHHDPGYQTADRIWLDLRERRSIDAYRAAADHERLTARAHLGALLDRLCRRIGADPVTWWRIPYAEEADR